jgi:glycine dehydrogenase
MSTSSLPPLSWLENSTDFFARHIGIDVEDEKKMLHTIGAPSRQALLDAIVPSAIRRSQPMELPVALSEAQALAELKSIAAQNKIFKNFIGQGYFGTHTPTVILRNILENPAWYTAYTPYQAEISQGRMEALINFQTMVTDLTGLPIAGASMLDEATAAAEAMTLAVRMSKSKSNIFFVANDVLPQTLAVVQTRAHPLGIQVVCGSVQDAAGVGAFACLFQYPGVNGSVRDFTSVIEQVHAAGGLAIMAADLLALTLLKPPGEMGADIAVGTTQRLGMPMGNGGPHAAYLATKDDFKRSLPGRLVGVSIDALGQPAYRLALQTREQHIRREKATSNICTAQVLPAVVSSMYAVYHGAAGLRRIAQRVAAYTAILNAGLKQIGCTVLNDSAFDTLEVETGARTTTLLNSAQQVQINLRQASAESLSISLDETTTRQDVETLWSVFATAMAASAAPPQFNTLATQVGFLWAEPLHRQSEFLTHPVFNTHHSETEMLRYIRSLSDKDLALDRTMIPLGSCTMKLNATSEMIPITWPQFAQIHPFAPSEQRRGYEILRTQLEAWLCQATGYSGISLQPNAGSQGEYAGLLAIKAYHDSRGESQRNICLIPESAHGTNPASAQMVGLEVVVVKCDLKGNVDLQDLKAKCERHSQHLAAVMITYPSTHGVFEAGVKDLCATVHQHGGRVYVDGANMNALVGVAAPGEFGGDVSHLNLHKTFCIPHGGGGPGVGPVCVVADLVPFLPQHPANQFTEIEPSTSTSPVGAVSAAPLGNAAVLPISWMYCRMMGGEGLKQATEVAILSANYIAARLAAHYPVLYSSGLELKGGGVAHECILDLRPLKDATGGAQGISAEDVAKRLIDYSFHAPTLSFPVPGTLMVEPTESEPLKELDRFCEAMIAIREEIRKVETGVWSAQNNPLKAAPHTAASVLATEWPYGYTREQAAFPVVSLKQQKYWPPVSRVDNVYGDRNLFCSCIPLTELENTSELDPDTSHLTS